jgi:hypothetical protein
MAGCMKDALIYIPERILAWIAYGPKLHLSPKKRSSWFWGWYFLITAKADSWRWALIRWSW